MTLRVATGPVDPAGTAGALVQGLRARGADAELAVWFEHPLGFAADRILPPLPRLGYVVALPLRRDVLHYQGFTWLRSARDATWARRLGRTLVVTFHGDDCRLYGVAQALFPARGRTGDPARDKLVRRRTRRLARLCDAALVPDLELATYVVPLFEMVYVVPPPLHAWPPIPAAPRRA